MCLTKGKAATVARIKSAKVLGHELGWYTGKGHGKDFLFYSKYRIETTKWGLANHGL